jgi:glyoxylate carboligase
LTFPNWLDHIANVKEKFPLIAQEHEDTNGYMNSYKVIERLNGHFKDDSIFVTDMGTALLSGFYGLNLQENQRLMTSTGLGEMGFGLPAAVGAAFGRPDRDIICLNADGGMMMNFIVSPGQDTALLDRNLQQFIAGYAHLYSYDYTMLAIIFEKEGKSEAAYDQYL